MLDVLTKGFRAARYKLRGVSEITEDNIKDALREVRMALLEADVDFKVAKSFINQVKEKLLGQEVRLKAQAKGKEVHVDVGKYFVKACYDELVELMGPVDVEINLPTKGLGSIMLVGLQGSGKTTTAAKLAVYLTRKMNRKPLLVAADVYRPAAMEQLRVLGERIGVPVYVEEGSTDAPGICERALKYARLKGRDTVIFDTAGRLAIDEPLMEELSHIKSRVSPSNIFLVLDAMIGQDAVRTAKAFDERLDLSGVILTKLDGDARGGAALSVKAVTGKPIKFLGMGEKLDRLEEFRPDGMAQRILGMGDIVGLMKDFEEVVDAEQAEKDAKKMLQGKFDMADFLEQIKLIQKMGSLKDLMEKLPFFADGMPEDIHIDDRELVRIEAIINSMTIEERRNPDVFFTPVYTSKLRMKMKKPAGADFEISRIRRVARGSGRREEEVKELLMKFLMMRQLMAELGKGGGLLSRIPGFKALAKLSGLGGGKKNQEVPGDLPIEELMQASGIAEMPENPEEMMPPPGMMPGPQRRKLSDKEKERLRKKRKEERRARKQAKKKRKKK